jgi:hypothetical protein
LYEWFGTMLAENLKLYGAPPEGVVVVVVDPEATRVGVADVVSYRLTVHPAFPG